MNPLKSATKLWEVAIGDCLRWGESLDSRNGASKEIIGYSATLADGNAGVPILPVRKISPVYMCAELLWYLSGESNVEMIQHYAPSYENYAESNGTAWGAYGARWLYDMSFIHERDKEFSMNVGDNPINTQLACIVSLLKEKPNTRQAVLTMWNAGDLPHAILGDKKDIPCTLSLQFLLRDKRLHVVTTMRSNDVWLGMPYDVYCFTAIQQLVAGALGVDVGSYHHRVGSLHLYDQYKDKAIKAMFENVPESRSWSYYPGTEDWIERIFYAINIETQMRKRRISAEDARMSIMTLEDNTLLTDVLAVIGMHHGVDARDQIKNPSLRNLAFEYCQRKGLFIE